MTPYIIKSIIELILIITLFYIANKQDERIEVLEDKKDNKSKVPMIYFQDEAMEEVVQNSLNELFAEAKAKTKKEPSFADKKAKELKRLKLVKKTVKKS